MKMPDVFRSPTIVFISVDVTPSFSRSPLNMTKFGCNDAIWLVVRRKVAVMPCPSPIEANVNPPGLTVGVVPGVCVLLGVDVGVLVADDTGVLVADDTGVGVVAALFVQF